MATTNKRTMNTRAGTVRSAHATHPPRRTTATTSAHPRVVSRKGPSALTFADIGLKLEFRRDMTTDLKGTWDPKCRTISINALEPKAGQLVTFIHEAMHAADDGLIGAGYLKHRTPHRHIQCLAPNIALLLVLAGFVKMPSEEFVEFYKANVREEQREAKRLRRSKLRVRKPSRVAR